MIQKFTILMTTALIATGCVGKDNFSASNGSNPSGGITNATATGGISGAPATSANSCSELGAYTSLASCKGTTFAQCYPSTKIIQGATAVCYFPVSGWENCASNPAAWSYGSWGNWCAETASVYVRTRTATCQRSLAACDCVTDSIAQDRCSTSADTSYTSCGFAAGTGFNSCNAAPTPVPTATPSATPSWCGRTFLNYEVGGNNSESVLRNVNNSRYSTIRSFFSGKGYNVSNIRGTTYTLSSVGPLLAVERSAGYVVQIEASSSNCWIGSKINLTMRLLKGGIEMTSGHETTSCVSFGDETGRALDRAMSRMSVAVCQ
jgi:hypothetical protein